MAGKTILDDRVKSLEANLKKYAIISSLAGLLLGGGGVFGVAQWAYKAPLDKQVLKYESAMKSLNGAIKAANESGAKEDAQQLRMELVALDRDYRQALGLLGECMRILSNSFALSRDERTRAWLEDTSNQLRELQRQRRPVEATAISDTST